VRHCAGDAGRLSARRVGPEKETRMLWGLIVILVVLWLLGFSLSIGGGLIHLLLVIALIVLLFNLISGRRSV
jgi:4-hydroxybenzoate polyprenyltransferase